MKNVYVLSTDKPSRLIIYSTLLNEFRLLDKPIDDWEHKQHIYITSSDEETKYGDWCYAILSKQTFQNINPNLKSEDKKKIILTTDQDLISDGVQAIDDEFLGWFVKNPSCEEVKVDLLPYDGTKSISKYWGGEYKIIIPQEEPKVETNMNGIYLSEEAKKAIEDKIAELEAKRDDAAEDNDVVYANSCIGQIFAYYEILSSATILPVAEKWAVVESINPITKRQIYPDGVIIQPKQ